MAGLLLRNYVAPRLKQIALPNAFLAAGASPTQHDRYGISTNGGIKQITAGSRPDSCLNRALPDSLSIPSVQPW